MGSRRTGASEAFCLAALGRRRGTRPYVSLRVSDDERTPLHRLRAPPGVAPQAAVDAMLRGRVPWVVARFGAPLALGIALYASFGLVDLFMVARLPDASSSVAALGLCEMVASLASILSYGISNATVAVIARRAGEARAAEIRLAVHQSLVLVVVLSLVFGAIGLFGSDFVIRTLLATRGHVAELAVGYLKVVLGGAYSLFLLLQVVSILRALGRAASAAALMVGGTALNVGLNALLIYGPGPHPDALSWLAPLAEILHVPRLEVIGAAWGTLIARTIPLFIAVPLLTHSGVGPSRALSDYRPDLREIALLLRIAWPSSLQLVLRVGIVLVLMALVNHHLSTHEDATVLAAYVICLRFETLVLFCALGWGSGAATFVGMNLGAERPDRARHGAWWSVLYALASTLVLVAIYVLVPARIVAFFDPSPAVVEVGVQYFRIVAGTYVFLAAGAVLAQAMSGAAATLPPLLIDAAVLLGLVLPAALALPDALGASPSLFFGLVAAGYVVAGAIYVVWYARGSFMRLAVRE